MIQIRVSPNVSDYILYVGRGGYVRCEPAPHNTAFRVWTAHKGVVYIPNDVGAFLGIERDSRLETDPSGRIRRRGMLIRVSNDHGHDGRTWEQSPLLRDRTQENMQKARKQLAQGFPVSAVAQSTGLPEATIRDLITPQIAQERRAFLSIRQTAKWLGIPEHALRRWLKQVDDLPLSVAPMLYPSEGESYPIHAQRFIAWLENHPDHTFHAILAAYHAKPVTPIMRDIARRWTPVSARSVRHAAPLRARVVRVRRRWWAYRDA